MEFFSCFLQPNVTEDEYLHDLRDCTNESPGACQTFDTVLTLSMMRRSFDVAGDMAAVVGAPVDPKWAATLAKVVPNPIGYMHGAHATCLFRPHNIRTRWIQHRTSIGPALTQQRPHTVLGPRQGLAQQT